MAGVSVASVTLDTGALLALERNRRDMVKLVAGAFFPSVKLFGLTP